jgi:NAD(P)-dependent dehydrogenase (short-subunit alcohol dehydrogenase family)
MPDPTSAAANGALDGFVTGAAAEMPRGIRINAVNPEVLQSCREKVISEVISDKNSLSDGARVTDNGLVCQGKGRHNMLGSLVIRSCERL